MILIKPLVLDDFSIYVIAAKSMPIKVEHAIIKLDKKAGNVINQLSTI